MHPLSISSYVAKCFGSLNPKDGPPSLGLSSQIIRQSPINSPTRIRQFEDEGVDGGLTDSPWQKEEKWNCFHSRVKVKLMAIIDRTSHLVLVSDSFEVAVWNLTTMELVVQSQFENHGRPVRINEIKYSPFCAIITEHGVAFRLTPNPPSLIRLHPANVLSVIGISSGLGCNYYYLGLNEGTIIRKNTKFEELWRFKVSNSGLREISSVNLQEIWVVDEESFCYKLRTHNGQIAQKIAFKFQPHCISWLGNQIYYCPSDPLILAYFDSRKKRQANVKLSDSAIHIFRPGYLGSTAVVLKSGAICFINIVNTSEIHFKIPKPSMAVYHNRSNSVIILDESRYRLSKLNLRKEPIEGSRRNLTRLNVEAFEVGLSKSNPYLPIKNETLQKRRGRPPMVEKPSQVSEKTPSSKNLQTENSKLPKKSNSNQKVSKTKKIFKPRKTGFRRTLQAPSKLPSIQINSNSQRNQTFLPLFFRPKLIKPYKEPTSPNPEIQHSANFQTSNQLATENKSFSFQLPGFDQNDINKFSEASPFFLINNNSHQKHFPVSANIPTPENGDRFVIETSPDQPLAISQIKSRLSPSPYLFKEQPSFDIRFQGNQPRPFPSPNAQTQTPNSQSGLKIRYRLPELQANSNQQDSSGVADIEFADGSQLEGFLSGNRLETHPFNSCIRLYYAPEANSYLVRLFSGSELLQTLDSSRFVFKVCYSRGTISKL
jgi:hypothetical protein